MAPAGKRPYKKTGIRPPRNSRTTAAYKHWIDEALKALASGRIDTNVAYAIETLASKGAEATMSIALQKRSREGIIVLEEDDLEQPGEAEGEDAEGAEIEITATEVVEDVPSTPNEGTEKNQRAGGAQIVALISPPQPANDVKVPDDAEDGSD